MFGAGGSIRLFNLFGVRIGVDPSWFVVLFIFIFLLSGSFQDTLDGSDGEAYVVAVISVLLFFLSLVLHELGHAMAARRQGIGVAGIDLWFFGGVAKMTRDTRSPAEEFKVAAAGPLVTLVLALLFAGGAVLASDGDRFQDAALLDSSAAEITPLLLVLSWLATINVALLVFNLIPAFPLDGGRIARALAWKLSGKKHSATRFASALGQGFSYICIGYGVFLVFDDAVTSGLWIAVLGWFIGQGARQEVRRTAFAERMEGLTVADVMDPQPVVIPSATPVAEALEAYFWRYGWDWFAVVDGEGRFLGIAHQHAVQEAVDGGQAVVVGLIVERDRGSRRIDMASPLEDLLSSQELVEHGSLMAVDHNGVLRGVITREQVQRAVAAALGGPVLKAR